MKTALCVFEKNNMVVLGYVDDSLLFSELEFVISEAWKKRNDKFRVKYLERQIRFLGFDKAWNDDDASLTMSQQQPIFNLLLDKEADQSKPVCSPIEKNKCREQR